MNGKQAKKFRKVANKLSQGRGTEVLSVPDTRFQEQEIEDKATGEKKIIKTQVTKYQREVRGERKVYKELKDGTFFTKVAEKMIEESDKKAISQITEGGTTNIKEVHGNE